MRTLVYLVVGLLLNPIFPSVCRADSAEPDRTKLTLEEAVRQALASNLGLQLQKDEVTAAEGVMQTAEGEFDTTATAQGGSQQNQYAPVAPQSVEEDSTTDWSVGAQKKFVTGTEMSLNWNNSRYSSEPASPFLDPAYNSGLSLEVRQPLLQGFGIDRQTANIRAAEKNLAAATELVDSEAANLAANVKNVYWNLVFAWQDKKVKELSLTLARKLLEQTEEQIRAGRLAEVEIYQPRSEIALREQNLILADRNIGLNEDQLKLLLNSSDWQSAFVPVSLPPTEPIHPDPQVIEAKAMAIRPDLKAAELSTEAARIQQEVARNNILPALDLVGSVGQSGTDRTYGDTLSDAVDSPETQWQAGLAFSLPLENNVAEGRLRQAKAAHSRAQNQARQLRLEIQKNVRTTVRDVQLAIKAMEATRKTALATQKRLEAEQAKFEVGRSTTFDVLTAQDAYSQALSQEKQSQVAYAQALAELARIQGLLGLPKDGVLSPGS